MLFESSNGFIGCKDDKVVIVSSVFQNCQFGFRGAIIYSLNSASITVLVSRFVGICSTPIRSPTAVVDCCEFQGSSIPEGFLQSNPNLCDRHIVGTTWNITSADCKFKSLFTLCSSVTE